MLASQHHHHHHNGHDKSHHPQCSSCWLKLKKSKEYKVIGKVKVIEAEALQHC